MARRKKKEALPEEIVLRVIGAVIFFVFLYRLQAQGISSISSIPSLLISSALYVVVFAAIAGVLFLIIKSIYQSGSKADIDLKLTEREEQVKESTSKSTNTALSSNAFKQELPDIQQAEKMPEQWTEELINKVEWRVFEKICMALWRIKGFAVEETQNGADGGVDFYLQANETKTRIGAVQCKSWKSKNIGVAVIRELQGVVASENLKLGLLMYSGKLSKEANDFLAKPTVTIKAQSAAAIFQEINKLELKQQEALFKEVIKEDYNTPSCPKCDIKFIERKPKKGGKPFWGCSSFPRCRQTMQVAKMG